MRIPVQRRAELRVAPLPRSVPALQASPSSTVILLAVVAVLSTLSGLALGWIAR